MAPETVRYQCLVVGELETNAYIVYSERGKECLFIDPGAEAEKLIQSTEALALQPRGIILTHGHIDHSGAVNELRARFPVPLLIHEADRELLGSFINREMAGMLNLSLPLGPDRLLADGDSIQEGEIVLHVLHTPGHTPGSIVLRCGFWLFTGDTLFQGGVGRTDLPGGDFRTLQRSLERLKEFPANLLILPGHGDPSTLEEELQTNPYL